MSFIPPELAFEPYRLYSAGVTQIENFAEQSRFSYQIAQRTLYEPDALPDDPGFDQTIEVLHTCCLRLEWQLFEVFLANTARALFLRHPVRLAAASASRMISYATLAQATADFTAPDQIFLALINAEIEQQRLGGRGALGLLDFIHHTFHLSFNPHELEYRFQGEVLFTKPGDLAAIATMCASFTNDLAAPSAQELVARYPELTIHQGQALVSSDTYLRSKVTINAVAATIAQCIENNWYTSD
ncbi:MAG: hypothetical protein AB4911_24230 [Oscillochloridaceae bacterium umkhey_bin13]